MFKPIRVIKKRQINLKAQNKLVIQKKDRKIKIKG